ncbi:MAG: hypothetical protein LAO18_11310 [Acidobacteriia bacterium]|jgi:hypothetical protein|nr:hypothetical protein [Terriglobia bacterium]
MASITPQMPVRTKAGNRLELLLSAPMNSWIALSKDESKIIAIGKTFMEADATAKQAGEKDYVLTRTPDAWLRRALYPVR